MAEPSAPPAQQRVDFYVLAGEDARERLVFACRIVEKACLADQRVFIWLDDADALKIFDELLWTFSQRSFVPHEIYADPAQWDGTPALISCGPQPALPFDVLVNLGAAVPQVASRAARVIEVIDADTSRRQSGRARFRHYRDQGIEPVTHNMST